MNVIYLCTRRGQLHPSACSNHSRPPCNYLQFVVTLDVLLKDAIDYVFRFTRGFVDLGTVVIALLVVPSPPPPLSMGGEGDDSVANSEFNLVGLPEIKNGSLGLVREGSVGVLFDTVGGVLFHFRYSRVATLLKETVFSMKVTS